MSDLNGVRRKERLNLHQLFIQLPIIIHRNTPLSEYSLPVSIVITNTPPSNAIFYNNEAHLSSTWDVHSVLLQTTNL